MTTQKIDGCSKFDRRWTWLGSICLCGFLLGACSRPATVSDADNSAMVQEWLQKELAPNEKVIVMQRSSFKLIGREFVRAKVVDKTTGVIREVVIDGVDGNKLTYEALLSETVSAWREQYGAVSTELVEQLDTQSSEGFLMDVELTSNKNLEDILNDLKSLSVEVISTHRQIVTVRGTAEQVWDIAKMDFVSVVTPHYKRGNLALNAAQDLGQSALATLHSLGVGVDWLVAIWEMDACVFHGHPDFSKITWARNSDCSVSNQSGHSTKVAGVLGALRENGRVGLFRARFLEVDARDAEAEDEMWRLRPIIINASFTITPHDGKDIDREVYEQGIFVFNGSGNDLEDHANCYAYNALCIGGYWDEGTINQYGDDNVAGSSFLNDHNNGREYPDVLGPYGVRTAGERGGYTTASGTSYSTPAIAGLAGLLLTSYPFQLFEKPALMRAVLMASAQAHPVIDDDRRIPDITDEIDDRMGVGVPDGFRAKLIMDEGTFIFRRITPTTLGLQTTFEVEAEERVRVVLAWDQCPGYKPFDPGGAQLFADLDMAIMAPSRLNAPSPTGGSEMVTYTNASFVDNQEIVEFISEASGTVNVIVSAEHFASCKAEGNAAVAPMAIVWTKEPAPSVFTE